jgi:penicillin G amidase
MIIKIIFYFYKKCQILQNKSDWTIVMSTPEGEELRHSQLIEITEKGELVPKLWFQRIEIVLFSYVNIILTSVLSLGLLLFLCVAVVSTIFLQFSSINHNILVSRAFVTIQEKKRIYVCCGIHIFSALLAWICLILLVVLTGFISAALATVEYQFSGNFSLDKIKANVTIRREDSGMIHIDAHNDYDLFFGQGYVSAQNRLWQMEFQRRVCKGTLSEVVGASALTVDKFTRTMGFYKLAQEDYKTYDQRSKNTTQAFIDGVNAFLGMNPPLPFEFLIFGFKPSPWLPEDVIVWGKLMAYDLSYNFRQELERFKIINQVGLNRALEIYPPYQRTDATSLSASQLGISLSTNQINQIEDRWLNQTGAYIPPIRANLNFDKFESHLEILSNYLPSSLGKGEASNNWVFSGAKTTTGKPFLCNDPHLGLTSPAIWYMIHLTSPNLELTGASLAGTPGIVIGKNRNIAWGITNLGADVEDLFALQEVNNGNAYMHKGVATNYNIVKETISIKGSASVTIDVKNTVFGPVINDVMGVSGVPLALKWTSLESNDQTFSFSYLTSLVWDLF